MKRQRVLFVTWDGPDQAYLESLFLPIYAGLAEHGYDFHVMQFRWGPAEGIASASAAARRVGIPYTHERVLRRPLSLGTAATVALGSRAVRRYVEREAIDIVMPRSTIPAAMMLATPRARRGARILFDADGLVADERVDFGGWSPTGINYRVFREAEAQMVRVADSVMTRTARARDTLLARAGAGLDVDKIHVIPNGKDEDAFTPGDPNSRARIRERLSLPTDAPVVVYVGSLGPHYYPDEMLGFFEAVQARRPHARFVILTGQEQVARDAVARAGLSPTSVFIGRVSAEEVPAYLAAADIGLALRNPSYSQHAVSPIKVSEYLLSGLPVVATRGVGDLDTQLGPGVGRLLDEPDAASLQAAADWFVHDALPDRELLRTRCRDLGTQLFGLGECVTRHAAALAYALR